MYIDWSMFSPKNYGNNAKYGTSPFRNLSKGKYKVHCASRPSPDLCLHYNRPKKYVPCVQVLILS